MKPIEEKKFWEWCGLTIDYRFGYVSMDDGIFYETQSYDSVTENKETRMCYLESTNTFEDETGKHKVELWWEVPPIDLNNLFRYAVPKLHDEGYDYKLWSDDGYHFAMIFPIDNHEDIVASSVIGQKKAEDALYWAIQDWLSRR